MGYNEDYISTKGIVMNKNIALLAIFVEGALIGGVTAGFVRFMQDQKEFDRQSKKLNDILNHNPFTVTTDTNIDNDGKVIIDVTVADK